MVPSLKIILGKILTMSNSILTELKDLLDVFRPMENCTVQLDVLIYKKQGLIYVKEERFYNMHQYAGVTIITVIVQNY